MTQAVSRVIAAATDSSLSLVSAAWQGVDLHSVDLQMRSGRVYLESPAAAEAVLFQDNYTGIPEQFWPPIRTALREWQRHRSAAMWQARLVSNSSWQQASWRLRVFDADVVGFAWTTAFATYTLEWANPLWAAMDFNAATEHEQVQTALKLLSADLADPEALTEEEAKAQDFAPRWWRLVCAWLRWAFSLAWRA